MYIRKQSSSRLSQKCTLTFSMTMHDSRWRELFYSQYSAPTHVDGGSQFKWHWMMYNNNILHYCDVSKVYIMAMNNHYQPTIVGHTSNYVHHWWSSAANIIRMMQTFAWALLFTPLGAPLPTSKWATLHLVIVSTLNPTYFSIRYLPFSPTPLTNYLSECCIQNVT